MTEYKWKYNTPDPFVLAEYNNHHTYDILSTILANRGLNYNEYLKIQNKFFPNVYSYCDKIVNLKTAAERILNYLLNKKIQIHIFTDYDSDGMTSLATALKVWLNVRRYYYPKDWIYLPEIKYYAPERSMGYGLNMNWCEELTDLVKNDNYDHVVICFDNGVTKRDEIKYLHDNNIEVTVIDHHEPEEILPDCLIVDPKKDIERFGEELCAAGLSWLLSVQLFRLIQDENPNDKYVNYYIGQAIKEALPNAAIGTIADMMNMTVLNLSLVYHGLKIINDTSRNYHLIWDYLTDCFNLKEVTSKDIGFSIGAAINACGQLESINTAIKFIHPDLSNKTQEAEDVYELYSVSRDLTKEQKKFIDEDIKNNNLFETDNFCIYVISGCPGGILGKLANHISNTTGKPTIVVKDNESDEMSGSGRCPNPTLDLLGLLQPYVGSLIKKANGHKAACGVTVYKSYLNELRSKLNNNIQNLYNSGAAEPFSVSVLNIDKKLDISDINLNNYKQINLMPYSMNFPQPVFAINGDLIKVKESKNNPNNICYTVRDKNNKEQLDIWAWNIKPQLHKATESKDIWLAGSLTRNFMNQNKITLDVIDIKFGG